jgi:hypothetical protein
MPPETCPNCGASVPARAKSCPECGACEESGWNEEAAGGNLDIPEETFDYDEFVKREFGPRRLLPHGIPWFWAGLSLVLAILLAWWFVK